MYKFIDGGVCAAKGFTANGLHCGIRKNRSKPDLALIYSETRCAAAGVFTQNLVKGAPVVVTKRNISDGYAQAVICNSGNANTCNADGIEKAEFMCAAAGEALGIPAADVIVGSTGVIGQPLNFEPVRAALPALCEGLKSGEAGSDAAAVAIMTTDTRKKEFAVETTVGGTTVHIGGIAKGSGMIMPNMATMLSFVTTDCAISPELLDSALREAVRVSFNRVSIDGDTSTNDTLTVMANGLAGNAAVNSRDSDYAAFCEGLTAVCVALARGVAGDGEGASRLLECEVKNFRTEDGACTLAKSVINSSLVKAAFFGADANWGRILCALGYAGVDADVSKISVTFASAAGTILVCENGSGVDFNEDFAKVVLTEPEIKITVDMNDGSAAATCWGCDLTYDYVKINGDYRT